MVRWNTGGNRLLRRSPFITQKRKARGNGIEPIRIVITASERARKSLDRFLSNKKGGEAPPLPAFAFATGPESQKFGNDK
jgi:hypothetical protein